MEFYQYTCTDKKRTKMTCYGQKEITKPNASRCRGGIYFSSSLNISDRFLVQSN